MFVFWLLLCHFHCNDIFYGLEPYFLNHLELCQTFFFSYILLYFLFSRSNNFDRELTETFYFSSNVCVHNLCGFKCQGDKIILVKLLVGDLVFNVISAYAPQLGLNESVKMQF
jgi:hypothetical protein